MAESSRPVTTSEFRQMAPGTVTELRTLLWGGDIKHDVFRRWTQGFIFSGDEPTALQQLEGGPCSIVAPTQGFVLKNILFNGEGSKSLAETTESDVNKILSSALAEILIQASSGDNFTLVIYEDGSGGDTSHDPSNQTAADQSPKKRKLSHECFHEYLKYCHFTQSQQLQEALDQYISVYTEDYGVLLFLYSLVLTKGIEQIKNEVEDPREALIDGIYGHGSQSVTNLMLTGRAVSNVWDNDKEVEGLKLQGIHGQATVGFLSLLEHLRYCEVGWNLKNPKYPIWLLGSETHLTVLFSKEEHLVVRETPDLIAKKTFSQFDPEGNGFISAEQLQHLLACLDLVSEPPEYLNIIKNKLDPEHLGIITLNSFMSEFYPGAEEDRNPESFTIYHYNGLQRSCPNQKLQYQEGKATIMHPSDTCVPDDSSSIYHCIKTKWPTIELRWKSNTRPSLN